MKNKIEIMQLKPVVTEKAVMMIESQNVLTFKMGLGATKDQIKKEVESLFDVKVEKIRVMNRNSKRYAYVKLNTKHPAIDIATKLGLI
jgi:large subunit ribosomal protein L23